MVNPRRNGFVDYARFLAALGIVWFHTHAPGKELAYSALPFFLVLLAMPSRADAGQRAKRLLLPFVTWSMIYAAEFTGLAMSKGNPPFGWWHTSMIVTGVSLHLWFLPFAFFIASLKPLMRNPF